MATQTNNVPKNFPIIRFHGATKVVTGSCYEIETTHARIIVDCGMFQGSKSEKELNYREFPFNPADIDAVVLTHAHIDHSGLLPKLVKHGFKGQIFATSATVELCSVMLPDSGYIQESEVKQLNCRNQQRGRALVEPIYTAEDARDCLTHFRPADYCEWVQVAEGIRIRFWNAGHLLGSASVQMEVTNGKEVPVRILFSGDIGPSSELLQPDPNAPHWLDYVVCESTYGNRDRVDVSAEERLTLLAEEVQKAVKRNGPLLIPSFAVERTQEVLVDLYTLMKTGRVPRAAVFVDSPLATKASQVFSKYARDVEHGEVLLEAFNSSFVRFTESAEQSKAISRIRGFHVIIAASGMCDAGRIRHHLKQWLWSSKATVLFVGFQAQGSLGRIILDGATSVRIQGEEIRVKANIASLDFYSGHADGRALTEWVRERLPINENIFLTHGEPEAMEGLKESLSHIIPPEKIIMPTLDQAFELSGKGAHEVEAGQPKRMDHEDMGRMDWHNDLSKLLLDISEEIGNQADERNRAKVIRRLRKALENGDVPNGN
ncbi:MBL fold metallo-hydrolase [Microvirga sp. W0021]|uniref:MBL fold metallo-hydrolase n=1 Tax=Hohaiivirga grylli TaxID=3133970 RepID=A0ABV0BF15_9HYPH